MVDRNSSLDFVCTFVCTKLVISLIIGRCGGRLKGRLIGVKPFMHRTYVEPVVTTKGRWTCDIKSHDSLRGPRKHGGM